jgi:hypothetical protein
MQRLMALAGFQSLIYNLFWVKIINISTVHI